MLVPEKKRLFHKNRLQDNPYRALILAGLVLGLLFIFRGYQTGSVQPFFLPTPTATRTVNSYAMEGEAQFQAGNLNAAIASYQQAVRIEPGNINLWRELARIQTYSSSLLTTDAEKAARMAEALASIDQALAIDSEDSSAHAIRAFVLDWTASSALVGDEWQRYLNEAEQEAVRALQLDNQNTLALAYYAEILVDQQKWLQAQTYIAQAVESDPTLMDVHRINAYVQETLGNYTTAIQEYQQAIEIAPNLTFLYLAVGANYRQLTQYDNALEYFDMAATINEQLNIQDPTPYLSIARTYAQMGEFFAAARNVRRALEFNPTSPDVYGQLGIIYFKARNYEGAIPALECAIRGCNASQSCDVRQCDPATDPEIIITGLPLTSNTVVYYFTYGSVLAGMHQPSNNYCEEAMQVLEEVRQGFSGDTTIMAIVDASEEICASFGFTRP